VDSLNVAILVFVSAFGGSMLGIYLRRKLPKSHLSSESCEVVKLSTGLIASVFALVLGLLIASAKSSFDEQRAGFQQLSTNLILLDRSLKFFGPETAQAREKLRQTITLILELRWPASGSNPAGLDSPELTATASELLKAVLDLSPKTDAQKTIQLQAIQLCSELGKMRWLLSQSDESSTPAPFTLILVLWITLLFITFGMFSPWNATVVTILFICSASLGSAMFLIEELDRPFHGWIQISSNPLRDALKQFDQ
jgi:hypothetical protein